MTFDDYYEYLLNLCDKLSHRVDEQDETIEYYQKEIKRLHQVFDIKDSARVELVKENTNLRKNIEHLCDENIRLRHELNEVKKHDSNY